MRVADLEETMVSEIQERLKGVACEIRFGEPLAPYTTFQIGGPADAIAFPKSETEMVELIERARMNGLPVTVLGGGANLLVGDGGVRGLVVTLSHGFRQLELSKGEPSEGEALLEAGAGVKIPALVRYAAHRGLIGLECLTGVPGTVGGALAMNAGTAERYLQDAVESIRWIRISNGPVESLASEALGFGYRQTVFPEPGIVVEVRFRLRMGEPAALLSSLREDATLRRERQPSGFPCAGSIFRNPPGDRAGRLIETAGMKGRRVGGVEVSHAHTNFFVNRGGATASDAMSLVEEVQGAVRERYGVELVLELKKIGEDAT